MLTEKDINKALKTLQKIDIGEASIDTDAAAILNSATKVFLAILAKREELDQQGREDEPLIVLAGEFHSRPSGALHDLAVLMMLNDREEPVSYTIEMPHDLLRQEYRKKRFLRPSPPPLPENFNAQNYTNDAKYYIGYDINGYKPYSRNILLHTCLEKDIPVKFVDTSYTLNNDGVYINASDASSWDSMYACLGYISSSAGIASQDGMFIRNHHMAEKIKDVAAQTKSSIVIHSTGAAHVAGYPGYDPEDSLSEIFKKRSIPLVAYHTNENEFYSFYKHALESSRLEEDDLIRLPRLPEHKAQYQNKILSKYSWLYRAAPPRDDFVTFTSHKTESVYANAVLAKMGMAGYGLTTPDFIKQRNTYKKEIKQTFKQWRQDLRNTF